MVEWNRNLSNLRNVLAGLYWDVADQRRFLRQVGLNPAYIRFNPRSVNTWQSILEEAEHHDKIRSIIAEARKEYPQDQSLILAEQNQLLMVEAPKIGEDEWRGPTDAAQLEKLIGDVSTLRPISFLEQGQWLSRSVVRVVLADGSSGSGFLIEDNLLITNNHVIPSKAAACGATVEFNFQKTAQGLDAPIDRYKLAPDEGFATSPREAEGGDDWTAVRVLGNPLEKWGALELTQSNPSIGEEVVIIQHPGGGPKQIALSHNIVAFVNERRLQYLTDTLEGSSGSPVFDMNWQVVALHHAGGWLREPGSRQAVFRNQGIHINVVIDGLASAGLKQIENTSS